MRPMRRRGLLGAVADFLVEPIDSSRLELEHVESVDPPRPQRLRTWARTARPVIAVAGLGPRCGTTTIARALGAELALRDPVGATLVSADALTGGGLPLGTPAAARLTRALARVLPLHSRTVGRLCLTACGGEHAASLADVAHELAPVVLDVGEPSQVAVAASLADAVVLVGSPGSEPALAVVLADSLRRVGPDPVVVLNRDRGEDDGRWDGRCALRLPESRMGAQLALAGREPRGQLGRATTELADLVAGP
ncbi:MAG TPA: hypothetical protein VEX36_09625 [Thermoleophilaceae bacterium]|nr:hypothetical protein [Thermoleophilaceae bacterium]